MQERLVYYKIHNLNILKPSLKIKKVFLDGVEILYKEIKYTGLKTQIFRFKIELNILYSQNYTIKVTDVLIRLKSIIGYILYKTNRNLLKKLLKSIQENLI